MSYNLSREALTIDLYRAITQPYALEDITQKGITLENGSTAQNADWFDDMTDWGGMDPTRTVGGLPVFTNLGEAKNWLAVGFTPEKYEKNRKLGKYAVVAHVAIPLKYFPDRRQVLSQYSDACVNERSVQLWANDAYDSSIEHPVPREVLAAHAITPNDSELDQLLSTPKQRDGRLSGEHFIRRYPHEALSDPDSGVVTQFYVPQMYLPESESPLITDATSHRPAWCDPTPVSGDTYSVRSMASVHSLYFASTRYTKEPHPLAQRADLYDQFWFPLRPLEEIPTEASDSVQLSS